MNNNSTNLKFLTSFHFYSLHKNNVIFLVFLFATTIAFAQPVNNSCSTATVLSPETSCSYGDYTLEGATKSAGVPFSSCATAPNREVWFKTTVPNNDNAVLVIQGTTNSNPIIAITIYRGTCGALTYSNCTTALESGKGYLSLSVSDENMKGEEIYIVVTRGNSDKKGDFKLCVFEQERPQNEDCVNAIELSNVKGTFEHSVYNNKFSNMSAEIEPDCGVFDGADIWFKTKMPATGKLVVHAKSNDISPVVALYTGSCGNLIYKTCATTSIGAFATNNTEMILNDVSLAEEMVYLRVYANGSAKGGAFELLIMELTQDSCSEARLIDGSKTEEIYNTYTNKYATKSVEVLNTPCGLYKGTDIWFTMEVPASGKLIIDSKASLTVKPVLTVYSGGCAEPVEVACNRFGSTKNPFGAKIDITPSDDLANQTIHLRMHNHESAVGGVFELSVHNPSAALPVELVRFTANTFNSEVILDWTTATEENNDYFLLEHSTDGSSFIPIEKIDGQGTTNELQHYNYVHDEPFYGENYYRLKQVDIDGTFEYFNVVVASIRLMEEQFKLFPNPASTNDVLTLRWSEDLGNSNLELMVTDALGKRVYQREVESKDGREAQINFSGMDMTAGIYFLQLSNERQVIAYRKFSLLVD